MFPALACQGCAQCHGETAAVVPRFQTLPPARFLRSCGLAGAMRLWSCGSHAAHAYVSAVGFEPTRSYLQWILSPPPFNHSGKLTSTSVSETLLVPNAGRGRPTERIIVRDPVAQWIRHQFMIAALVARHHQLKIARPSPASVALLLIPLSSTLRRPLAGGAR